MLSRRSHGITGGSGRAQPRMKPVKARRVIRRFHFLINKRAVLNRLLGFDQRFRDNDEGFNSGMVAAVLAKDRKFQRYYDEGIAAAAAAPAARDGTKATAIESQLLKLNSGVEPHTLLRCLGYIQGQIHGGGLQNYQLASTVGQDKSRGGDSSKQLVKWLRELQYDKHQDLTALEIGSLSVSNYIGTCKIFERVERIDLNSNDKAIIRQDFMKRPLPVDDSQRFNLISCSLVLNFVSTPAERGQMCKLFSHFLIQGPVPSYLFVVLPLPCVVNSRYTTIDHFIQLMTTLGFQTVKRHSSNKLFYILLQYLPAGDTQINAKFLKKKEINPGPGRNNFAILL